MANDDETLLALLNKKEAKKTRSVKKAAGSSKFVHIMKTYNTVESNNWMNIRHSKLQTWLGEIGNLGGFVLFDKPEHSVRAFYKIMKSYMKQNANTISLIANKYAPEEDGNHPDVYINNFIANMKKNGVTWTKDKVIKDGAVADAVFPIMAQTFMDIESSKLMDLEWFKNIYETYL